MANNLLRKDQIVDVMTDMFKRGLGLDMVDISGIRDNPGLDEKSRYIYDTADVALERIDLDELYDNAEKLDIPGKYPEFYDFLSERCIVNDSHEERTTQGDLIEEDIDEAEEIIEDLDSPQNIKDSVVKNVVGGEHTGKESDSNKWVESDEYRQQLTDDYNKMIADAGKVGSKSSVTDITKDLHNQKNNVSDVTNVIKGTAIAGEKEEKESIKQKKLIGNKKKKKKKTGRSDVSDVQAEHKNITTKDVEALTETADTPNISEHNTQIPSEESAASSTRFVQDSYESINHYQPEPVNNHADGNDISAPKFGDNVNKEQEPSKVIIGKKSDSLIEAPDTREKDNVITGKNKKSYNVRQTPQQASRGVKKGSDSNLIQSNQQQNTVYSDKKIGPKSSSDSNTTEPNIITSLHDKDKNKDSRFEVKQPQTKSSANNKSTHNPKSPSQHKKHDMVVDDENIKNEVWQKAEENARKLSSYGAASLSDTIAKEGFVAESYAGTTQAIPAVESIVDVNLSGTQKQNAEKSVERINRERTERISGRADKVDVGVIAAKHSNRVTLKTGGVAKTYTVRSDNTIVVDGVKLNVYDMKDDKAFVGHKNASIYGGKVTTSDGQVFDVNIDGDTLKDNPGHIDMKIHRNVGTSELKQEPSMSVIGTMAGDSVTEKDFSVNEETKTATINDSFSKKYASTNIDNVIRKNDINRNMKAQGRAMHLMLSTAQLNKMYNIELSKESVDIMVQNYNKILASNITGPDKACKYAKMNAKLENTYLNEIDIKNLRTAERSLKNHKMTQDVDKLKIALEKGSLTAEQAKVAANYINIYDSTREKIIKKGVLKASSNKGRGTQIEHGFFASSMSVILHENGLPNDKKSLKKLLKDDNVTAEQKKIAKNVLTIQRSMQVLNTTEKIAKGIKDTGVKAYSKASSLANKYMSNDATMKGLLLSAGAVGMAINMAKKSYKTVKRTRRFAHNLNNAIKGGAKATQAAAKATSSIARASAQAAVKGVNLIRKKGVKAAAKQAKKVVIKSTKKIARFSVKTVKNITKVAAKTIIKVIVRILTVLVTTLASLLGPIILLIIFLLTLIFSILSFLNNQGDTVYYDAGDEDTAIVLQEMVDVLTLCNDSFKTSLSSQFGSASYGGGASGNDDSALQAPQMKKGDSSPVEGLYNVKQSSWWNYEFTYQYIHNKWANGTRQQALDDMFDSGQLSIRGNGNYAFVNEKMYMAAFGTYWGNVGDVLKVEFNDEFKIGDQPASNIMYIIIADEKAWKDTGYPSQPEGIYGHVLSGNSRDFAEFIGYWEKPSNLNNKGLMPVKATNLGSILDGTCDMDIVGTSSSSGVNADVLYRQEIDQDTYREIISHDTNIYYTFPEDQRVPDGITPTPAPAKDADEENEMVYGFYNNHQELISMVLAMFDFDINATTSVKKTLIVTKDTSGSDDDAVDSGLYKTVTNKINDDTWRLITYLDENDLNLEKYSEGGYDDLRYSALVGLYNASHIVTYTPVYEYHEGPDGTINPVYNSEGRIIGQTNTDGYSYQVLVMETKSRTDIVNGEPVTVTWVGPKIDANGEYVYETKYSPCLGHKKNSAAVITLHFDALLDLEKWWEDNIYNVEDFDKENPNYSSSDKEAINYNARNSVLKNGFQCIKKPDFYKAIGGTCNESSASSASSTFTPGTMSESQVEVARTTYNYLTGTMNLTSEQAYGVLANIKRECDFNYTLVEVGGSGYGLCQWTGGRRENLIQWCNTHPEYGAYNTLQGQLAFLDAEINNKTGYSSVWTGNGVAGFLRCTTATEAGEYFIRYFERPAAVYMEQRIREMASDIATIKQYIG